ncbi:MAG: VWA domain-containing protein [Gammaproteobacteria bacterium]|nr:VWA domain-containing protein [Gammaproteobacteria bacterium]
MVNRLILILASLLLLGACGDSKPVNRTSGVYLLLDTSGTYSEEIEKARQIIYFTLSKLDPGDSFAVARIDTGSFSEKDIVAKVTFDSRPSTANGQKRRFQEEINSFVETVQPSSFTDISGGLLQAIEFLNEKQPGRKIILIFSDLKEDLEEGFVRDFPIAFNDVNVIALNVTKLRSDNVDPREYLDRLRFWRQRVENGGGNWRVINDLDRLEKIFG